MPLLATATTIDVLQTAFITAIHGMTPRMQRSQAIGWKYYSRKHDPLIGTRWFRFEWSVEAMDDGIQTHAVFEVAMSMLIVVDYGGLPDQDVDALVHDDWLQVEGTLDALRTPTAGLRRVLALPSWEYTDDSQPDQNQIAFPYRVRYLHAKV